MRSFTPRERMAIVAIHYQACDFIRLVGNDGFVEEARDGNFRET